MHQDLLLIIQESLIDGEVEQTVQLTRQALSEGIAPMVIIEEGLIPGMNVVGEKFSNGEFYLPNLIIAANAMKDAMTLLEPELHARNQQIKSAGVVVIGTVQGDIHEIGKSLVGTMLSANGFKVFDLGVDVPVNRFVDVVRETNANLLGLSALLTTTMTNQRAVIQRLIQEGLRDKVCVMVGGAPVTQSWAVEIGADGFAEDAMGAVTLARKLVQSKG